MMPLTQEVICQLWWWKILLPACAWRLPLPDPDRTVPAWAKDAYTDAAGGSIITKGVGSGVIVDNWWTYLPWSDIINQGGVENRGKRLRSKLSALELVGPLLVVCCNTEELRGKPIQVHVDNSGSVEIWRKGYSSSCDLSTTLVKTIHQVAV